jgi:hypothetical protein
MRADLNHGEDSNPEALKKMRVFTDQELKGFREILDPGPDKDR